MKTVIFTDLDGTFLNHDDYSFTNAKEALQKIEEKSIPLIFTTSKTKVEAEVLQKKVGIKEPFIIENGAAIFFPKNYQNLDLSFLDEFENYYILQLGLTYKQILNFYNKYKEEFTMTGFSDMNLDEIIKYTGLDFDNAKLSKQRDFTEPFLLEDESKLENLKNLAATYNIKITKGGRFYHLIGEFQDKGKAVKKAKKILKDAFNEKIKSIALGDGENDIENIQKSKYKGSKGWNEMVLKNV